MTKASFSSNSKLIDWDLKESKMWFLVKILLPWLLVVLYMLPPLLELHTFFGKFAYNPDIGFCIISSPQWNLIMEVLGTHIPFVIMVFSYFGQDVLLFVSRKTAKIEDENGNGKKNVRMKRIENLKRVLFFLITCFPFSLNPWLIDFDYVSNHQWILSILHSLCITQYSINFYFYGGKGLFSRTVITISKILKYLNTKARNLVQEINSLIRRHNHSTKNIYERSNSNTVHLVTNYSEEDYF